MQYLKRWVKKNFTSLIYRKQYSAEAGRRFSGWIHEFATHPEIPVQEASRDLFTYHGEDGIIAWLLARLADVPPVFTDIGAGDCVKSNCASLAVHAGWTGSFIDGNKRQLDFGRAFYKKVVKKERVLSFVHEKVTPSTINDLIKATGTIGIIGLLSVDIDGNDFWIWKSIDIIRPRIVVIEAKVEFGPGNYVVPFGDFNHHSADARYNGASVEAFQRLGRQKGYKLVAANKQGYNLFFVQEQEKIKEISVAEVLSDPETLQSFYGEDFFNSHHFEKA